jgi:hypothetical protein
MIKKISTFILKAVSLLLLVFAVMFIYGRMRGPTPEQQQALALLEQKPAFKPKENMAAYMWLINYKVPIDRIEAIAETDAKKYNALTTTNEITAFHSSAEGKYPKRNFSQEEFNGYCSFQKGEECLSAVRKNLATFSPALEKMKDEIAAVEKISEYKFYQSPFEFHMTGMLPGFSAGQNLLRVHYAHLFLNGQEELAIEKVCRDIGAWRSIASKSDNLLAAMVGHSYVRNRSSMLAEMLAATSAEAPIPEQCAIALKDISPDENHLCNAMKGEFGFLKNIDVWINDASNQEATEAGKIKHKFGSFFYDHNRTVAMAAPTFASFCSAEVMAAAAKNTVLPDIESEQKQKIECDVFDQVSNGYGCILIDTATPSYASYYDRKLDQSAQITAMQILVWLRENKASGNTAQQLFSTRPANLRAFSDRIQLNTEKAILEVNLLSPSSDGAKIWAIPLSSGMQAP